MILDLVYLLLAVLIGPFYLLSRLARRKRLASPWRRLGFIEPLPERSGPVVWLHAVSVGEALALRALIQELRRRLPAAQYIVTCTTVTGLAVARQNYTDLPVLEAPYDLSGAVKRFLRRIRPSLLVLAELELWPNWLRLCARAGIPVAVVNAKMSPSSGAGYGRLLRLWPSFLDPVRLWLAQSPAHASRIRELAVSGDRVRVTGNLKFDNAGMADPEPDRRRLRAEHGIPDAARILVAGSTHPGEEPVLAGAFRALGREFPPLRLVLCPRHPERVADVREILRRSGVGTVGLRSRPGDPPDPEVILVDTLGELSMLYALADVAFVGGTLVPVGGHNLLEPARFGLPIVTGRYLDTIQETAAALREAGALHVVADGTELIGKIAELLRDPRSSVEAAEGARAVIRAHQGSVARTAEAVTGMLSGNGRPLELDHHA